MEVKTGRKWSVAIAVTEAESRLKHKDIVGTAEVGRQGLSTLKKAATGRMQTLRRDEIWSEGNQDERRKEQTSKNS